MVSTWNRFSILTRTQTIFFAAGYLKDMTGANHRHRRCRVTKVQGLRKQIYYLPYCVCLELRSVPSTGVTRLPRYYEPLHHPGPSLSLTGSRLVIAYTPWGSVRRCRHLPGFACNRI